MKANLTRLSLCSGW